MILKNKFTWLLGLVILMTSCLDDSPTEIELDMERDDLALEYYINSNNIDATKTQSGYYYTKTVEKPDADLFVSDDYIGVYYEIKSLDGQLIDSHLDESLEPKILNIVKMDYGL